MYVAPTVEEFRQVAPIAAAQGIGVVNGGYTYDGELVPLLPQLLPGVTVAGLDAPGDRRRARPGRAGRRAGAGRLLAVARATLDPLDCDVVLRAFRPVTVPALYLDSRAARAERTRAESPRDADDLWAEILGALKSTRPAGAARAQPAQPGAAAARRG